MGQNQINLFQTFHLFGHCFHGTFYCLKRDLEHPSIFRGENGIHSLLQNTWNILSLQMLGWLNSSGLHRRPSIGLYLLPQLLQFIKSALLIMLYLPNSCFFLLIHPTQCLLHPLIKFLNDLFYTILGHECQLSNPSGTFLLASIGCTLPNICCGNSFYSGMFCRR